MSGFSFAATATQKKPLRRYQDLSDEQQKIIDFVKKGKNVFVDACIGSGKTSALQTLYTEEASMGKKVIYLTYNRLLKFEAKERIPYVRGCTVTNYHGFAWLMLNQIQKSNCGVGELPRRFYQERNAIRKVLPHYDLLLIDEYQDINSELAAIINVILECNPDIQIVAVGDMAQRITDTTTLNIMEYIEGILGEDREAVSLTQCFRLNSQLAGMLGNIWQKNIVGVNAQQETAEMTMDEAIKLAGTLNVGDILCLGQRNGQMTDFLNILERNFPQRFNKNTVYASIRESDSMTRIEPDGNTAIFTTYDSSKGMERDYCFIFDFEQSYWYNRLGIAGVQYEILRNIFCVAASRGKRKIIFVQSRYGDKLTEEELSTPTEEKADFFPFDMSTCFEHKFREHIVSAYECLKIKKLKAKDTTPIEVKTRDGMIDLSPCIGIYQEALFFNNYDLDDVIEFCNAMHPDRPAIIRRKSMSDEEVILAITAADTGHQRYRTQVDIPIVEDDEKERLFDRLKELLKPDEPEVQCGIVFGCENTALPTSPIEFAGRCDVLRDDAVFELKFVSELSYEHFLQCALYMFAFGKEKGILWNVKNNERYEIRIPDKKKFMDAVVTAVTKGVVTEFRQNSLHHDDETISKYLKKKKR